MMEDKARKQAADNFQWLRDWNKAVEHKLSVCKDTGEELDTHKPLIGNIVSGEDGSTLVVRFNRGEV